MSDVMIYAIYGTVTGILGTGIGGILAFVLGKNSNKFLSGVLEYSAGLMMAVVLFDLLPEAFENSPLILVLFGVAIGIFFMFSIEALVESRKKHNIGDSRLISMGISMAIGIAMHNFPEGLAIGSGFLKATTLGFSLAITILIHNIPEGMAMAAPMRAGGMNAYKAITLTMITGLPTGIGAFIGAFIGEISRSAIAFCLSIAAGAMLYVVLAELIPQSKKLYSGRLSSFLNILGVITGVTIANFL